MIAVTPADAGRELNAAKAAVLGVVEGVTEYLPVSSTGHLLFVEELLDVGTTEETEDAADTYAITIQAGAILAVIVVFHRRLGSILAGIAGRDPTGRHVFVVLAAAFLPAAVIGVALERPIKDNLFSVGPVIAAWIVGGVVILVAARLLRERPPGQRVIEQLSWRDGVIVGFAQALALWPGVSRSLVTILAALALGCTMAAALEFSFLLGLGTLTAATGFEMLRNGGELFDTFGIADPLIGFVVAFVAAVIAVRWLVAYLDRRGLELFAWYRLAIGAVALGLVVTGVV
jgi:undecaprenyl-diphosphatase